MSATIEHLVRFLAKRKTGPGCWEWTGCIVGGYGQMAIGTKRYKASRLAWFFSHDEWPQAGLVVRHKCDNRACVRPDHLELGSVADNNRDRDERGRSKPIRGESRTDSKLTEDRVRYAKTNRGLRTIQSMADEFGVTVSALSSAMNGRNWGWVR